MCFPCITFICAELMDWCKRCHIFVLVILTVCWQIGSSSLEKSWLEMLDKNLFIWQNKGSSFEWNKIYFVISLFSCSKCFLESGNFLLISSLCSTMFFLFLQETKFAMILITLFLRNETPVYLPLMNWINATNWFICWQYAETAINSKGHLVDVDFEGYGLTK